MNENTTLEIIAPTVEEAISQGLVQLGLPAEAVSVEVLDAGTKGLFGLGGRQVRVRLTVHDPDQETTSEAEAKTASQKKKTPVPQKKKKAPQPKQEGQPVSEPVLEMDDLLNKAEELVSKMLYLMQLEAQVSAHYGEAERDGRRPVHVDVHGNDLSILIGRRSETLNALQYIVSLILGKEMEQWVHLIIDVEGYRNRREKQLRKMANRMADQVAKTGRRQALEPMTSAERRIIHIALRDHPAVITESTGDDPHRKVVIYPKED
jgi:spoIIIJ-associated protein